MATKMQKGTYKKIGSHFKKNRHAVPMRTDNVMRVMADELYAAKQFPQAVEAYLRALVADPKDAHGWNNLGSCYTSLGQLPEAKEAYDRSIQLNPHYYGPFYNLSQVYIKEKDFDNAIICLKEAVMREGCDYDAWSNLATLFAYRGDFDQCLFYAGKACAKFPKSAAAYNNIGQILHQLRKYDMAIIAFEQAIERENHDVKAYLNLGGTLYERGNFQEARKMYQALGDLFPKSEIALRPIMIAPIIPQSLEEIQDWSVEFVKTIDTLRSSGPVMSGVPDCSSQASFYAAYYGENYKDLVVHVSDIFRRCYPFLSYTSERLKNPVKKKPGEKLKVCFFSRFFYFHSVYHCFKNLIENMPQDEFDVSAIYIQAAIGTKETCRLNEEKVNILPFQWDPQNQVQSMQNLRAMVEAEAPDILVFADIGMEPTSYFLAHSRLAPVQCVLTGHPHTTGISTIDYFISGDRFEAPNAQERYSEKLVRLKSNVVTYSRPTLEEEHDYTRTQLCVPEEGNLYLCTQTLFKLHPCMDKIFLDILHKDPNGYIVITSGDKENWLKLLLKRMKLTLADVFERIIVVPWMPTKAFFKLLSYAKVLLDTHPFGGGNTILQSLSFGLPVVAMPGDNLSSRSALAHYTQMGYLDMLVKTPEAYVDLVVKLGTDDAFWTSVHDEILKRSHVLYDEQDSIREHCDFFKAAYWETEALSTWITDTNTPKAPPSQTGEAA